MSFRKKPIVIEAVQWDGTLSGVHKIKERFPLMDTCNISYHEQNDTVSFWEIGTLEGKHTVSPNDWVIKGIKGEYYPCKPDIFEATYEEVKEA